MTALSLLAVAGATGAQAAAAPFGWFGGFARSGNAASGVEPVQGWALAQAGVLTVDIVVDGVVVARANYGRSRPGVTKLFPGYPDSAAPGFGYQLDTTHFLNGLHRVSARVTSRTGQVANLNSVTLQFANTNEHLLPFGKIEFPSRQAELYGNCNLSDPRRQPIWSIVWGYALDVNASQNNAGVAYVELLIDGAIFANSQYDCVNIPAAGGLAGCYGVRRMDVEQNYPGLKDAPHSGFRFALDVGALIGSTDSLGTSLYTPGSHQLNIRVGDQFENVTDLGSVTVTFTCRDFTNEDVAIGQVEQPSLGRLYGGLIAVSGWAVDLEGVAAVLIYVDGNLVNFATLGVPRPDIRNFYPSYPANPAPGWYAFIDTTQLSNGEHEIAAQVIDNNGFASYIGNFPITVENPLP
jgi:hypothetical protein